MLQLLIEPLDVGGGIGTELWLELSPAQGMVPPLGESSIKIGVGRLTVQHFAKFGYRRRVGGRGHSEEFRSELGEVFPMFWLGLQPASLPYDERAVGFAGNCRGRRRGAFPPAGGDLVQPELQDGRTGLGLHLVKAVVVSPAVLVELRGGGGAGEPGAGGFLFRVEPGKNAAG